MSHSIRARGLRPLSRAIQLIFGAALAVTLASACGSSTHPGVYEGDGGGAGPSAGRGSDVPAAGAAGKPSAAHGGASGGAGKPALTDDAGSAGDVSQAEAGAPAELPACLPVYTSCDSLCGPVHDPCTGLNLDCGGCATGLACDRDTHACVAPKLTCLDLGAECGRIRNTCGERLDCGDCPDGQECDPDTNKCTACTNPSCADLGYECGAAWLGCGDHKTSTNCGDCAKGSVCNAAYNRCEPAPAAAGGSCVPKSVSDLCAAENAQCGYISDGCGGTVKCGDCPVGQDCATDGIANRCGPPEAPWQCIVEQRECGQTMAQCGGKLVDCGTCAAPDVCNSNGKCGAPCVPKLPAEADAVSCGSFDDGCKGKLSKDCPLSPKGAKEVCKDDGSCCVAKTCADDYKDQCGTGLSDGCGSTVDCNCAAGSVCSAKTTATTGSCCQKHDCSFYPGQCGTLDDGCGGTISCGCGSQTCKKASGALSGTCCDLPVCNGQCNTTLSNACGSKTCSTTSCGSGKACDTTSDTCCALPVCNGACGVTLTNSCGSKVCSADCGSNKACNTTSDTCCDLPKCGTACGKTLSNSCGSVDCKCTGTALCQGAAGAQTCCTPRTCGGYYSGKCGTQLDDGCGGKIDCGCTGTGNVCSKTAANTAGACSCPTPKTCADFPEQCGGFPNGCGGTLNCTCADHGLPAYETCGGSQQSGVCGCTKNACGSHCGKVDDGCGGQIDCGPC